MQRLLPCWVLLVVLLSACKRTHEFPAAVEVITGPAEVTAAREVWETRRVRLLAELLDNPGGIRSYDEESVEILKANRPQAVAALLKLRDDPGAPAKRRLEAILALRLLDEAPSVIQMVELASADPEAASELLGVLYDLYPDEAPLPPELRQAIGSWVASKDKRLRTAALISAGFFRVSEAAAPVLEQLASAGADDHDLFLSAARLAPSADLLARLEKRVKPVQGFGAPAGLDAIRALGEATEDPALRRQAAMVATKVLVEQADHPWIDGESLGCLEIIASVQPTAGAEELLGTIVTSARWNALRRSALEKLSELNPASAAKISESSGVAMKEPGQQDSRGVEISAPEGARILVESGVLTRREADIALDKLKNPARKGSEGRAGAVSVLEAAGRLLSFDTETGMVPTRHDRLLRDFARASAHQFNPEAEFEWYVPDQKNPDSGSYLVQFIHSGRLYRFRPRDLGDWYDVEAVTAAVERALSDAGVPERFVPLSTGDQTATYIFGRSSALKAVSSRLGFDLGSDPGQPFKAGRAFEERVRRELGK